MADHFIITRRTACALSCWLLTELCSPDAALLRAPGNHHSVFLPSVLAQLIPSPQSNPLDGWERCGFHRWGPLKLRGFPRACSGRYSTVTQWDSFQSHICKFEPAKSCMGTMGDCLLCAQATITVMIRSKPWADGHQWRVFYLKFAYKSQSHSSPADS